MRSSGDGCSGRAIDCGSKGRDLGSAYIILSPLRKLRSFKSGRGPGIRRFGRRVDRVSTALTDMGAGETQAVADEIGQRQTEGHGPLVDVSTASTWSPMLSAPQSRFGGRGVSVNCERPVRRGYFSKKFLSSPQKFLIVRGCGLTIMPLRFARHARETIFARPIREFTGVHVMSSSRRDTVAMTKQAGVARRAYRMYVVTHRMSYQASKHAVTFAQRRK